MANMIEVGWDGKRRCFGGKHSQDLLTIYHDEEWGIPVYDDRLLFEMLVLEGAQAGLNWEIILNKRLGYRRAFYDFDVQKVAGMGDAELEALRGNPDIIRNRLKIYAARKNARAFIAIQKEFGSFSNYIWGFVDAKPIVNHAVSLENVPVTTTESDTLSKNLQKRGMSFVGSTIIYAMMQGVGLVNDHVQPCWCYGR